MIILGDSKEKLKELADNSIDDIITDPPYQLSSIGKKRIDSIAVEGNDGKGNPFCRVQATKGFMSKSWDVLPPVELWKECLRVLKPGAWCMVMTTPRQDSLTQVLIDLATAGFNMGFSSIYWSYASGFPKAHNISKAMDKKNGYEGEVVGYKKGVGGENLNDIVNGKDIRQTCEDGAKGVGAYGIGAKQVTIDIPIKSLSEEAKKFDGSYGGFQPKPAVEIILVCQKPMTEKTFVGQALDNGKGITWLDVCRIPYKDDETPDVGGRYKHDRGLGYGFKPQGEGAECNTDGRFPANLLISDNVLDEHSRFFSLDSWAEKNLPFLITPKASKKEKNAGLDEFEENDTTKNNHPCCKPIKLMSYLITMTTRPGDMVLDPFCGSGTTGCAAAILDREFVGIEMDPEYIKIAEARIDYWKSKQDMQNKLV